MKAEVSVLSDSVCFRSSSHVHGSIADNVIFRRRLQWHKVSLKKQDCELYLTDTYIESEDYPDCWSVLANDGYLDLQRELSAIRFEQKRPDRRLADKESRLI